MTMRDECEHCDGESNSAATYAGQVMMPLDGKVRCIDHCIHHIVAALNAGGVETTVSCCGHGKSYGLIWLADGRSLTIHDGLVDDASIGAPKLTVQEIRDDDA